MYTLRYSRPGIPTIKHWRGIKFAWNVPRILEHSVHLQILPVVISGHFAVPTPPFKHTDRRLISWGGAGNDLCEYLVKISDIWYIFLRYPLFYFLLCFKSLVHVIFYLRYNYRYKVRHCLFKYHSISIQSSMSFYSHFWETSAETLTAPTYFLPFIYKSMGKTCDRFVLLGPGSAVYGTCCRLNSRYSLTFPCTRQAGRGTHLHISPPSRPLNSYYADSMPAVMRTVPVYWSIHSPFCFCIFGHSDFR